MFFVRFAGKPAPFAAGKPAPFAAGKPAPFAAGKPAPFAAGKPAPFAFRAQDKFRDIYLASGFWDYYFCTKTAKD
jgi:hypothetical protein